VKAWKNHFHDVIGHQWQSLVRSVFLPGDNSNVHGVVTYALPVEAFVTGIRNLHLGKPSLIAWSLHSEALDCSILWEFKGQNVATPAKYVRKGVDRLILVTQNSSWSLDWLLKRTLIAWSHFDLGCKCFYRRHLCDYPLNVGTCPNLSSPFKSCLKYSHGKKSYCWGHSINHSDLQPKSGCQPTSDIRKGWKFGKSVRIHTKQLIIDSWEVWTYSLISGQGLQFTLQMKRNTRYGVHRWSLWVTLQPRINDRK